MRYFAYGSNMDNCEIVTALGSKPKTVGTGKLTGYRLAYNKKSSKNGTGKANIYPGNNVSVYGVVYEVTETQMKLIDKKKVAIKE